MKNNFFFFFFEKNIELVGYNNLFIKYNLNKHNINKLSYNKKPNIYSILLLFIKNGNLKKTFFLFFNIIGKLNLYLNNKIEVNKYIHIINEFHYNFNTMLNYNNYNFILLWSINLIESTFSLKSKKISKNYKKTTTDKYSFILKYIFKKYRNKEILKNLKFLYSSNNKSYFNNLFLLFFELIFNYKNNIIYLNKLKIYNKLLKS